MTIKNIIKNHFIFGVKDKELYISCYKPLTDKEMKKLIDLNKPKTEKIYYKKKKIRRLK